MRGTGKAARRTVLVLKGSFTQFAVIIDKHVGGLSGGQSDLPRNPVSDRILIGVDAMHLSANRTAVMVPA